MSKGNPQKKEVWQDNFIKRWCCSSKNHPEGWAWWKKKNRKDFRHKDKEQTKDIVLSETTEQIIGYRYKLFYKSELIKDDGQIYSSVSKANKAAEDEIDYRIGVLKFADEWSKDDSKDKFDIIIVDVME